MSAVINTGYTGIRTMQQSDLDAVMAIETAIYPFPWTRGIFSDCIRVGYRCHVYQDADEVLAYSVFSVAATEAHILTVCVHPDWRRQGLGRKMMEYMLEQAEQAGAEVILLEVRPSNTAAIQLYRDMQFNEVGIRPDYYPAVDGREDALIMARSMLRE
ncbi:MAG: ribosomal protein S18-alanine N-acetyltransferase [Proteobacteria bacterium]|jgi:ribosomal-protein-alanine N-acetyltransferase|nr:ribosomal protein S18-alanine N-acetyltransferase [Pseudomonadota bacterium]